MDGPNEVVSPSPTPSGPVDVTGPTAVTLSPDKQVEVARACARNVASPPIQPGGGDTDLDLDRSSLLSAVGNGADAMVAVVADSWLVTCLAPLDDEGRFDSAELVLDWVVPEPGNSVGYYTWPADHAVQVYLSHTECTGDGEARRCQGVSVGRVAEGVEQLVAIVGEHTFVVPVQGDGAFVSRVVAAGPTALPDLPALSARDAAGNEIFRYHPD